MKNYLLCVLFLFSVNAHCGGWSQKGKIIEIYNHGYTVMVKLSGEHKQYDSNCLGKGYYAINASDSTSFSILYSQLLMIHASGKRAQFWVNSGSCSGQGGVYQTIQTVKSFQ